MNKYTFTKDAEKFFHHIEEPKKVVIPVRMKKFNLKLSNDDLNFIQFLANKDGNSRNKYLDKLIEDIIFDFLNSLEVEEYILLIKFADYLNGVNTEKNMDKSWISELYPSTIPYDLIQDHLHNQAPLNDLSERSDRYKIMFTKLKQSKLVTDFNAQLKGKNVNEPKK